MAILIPRHRHFIDGDTIAYDTETTGRSAWMGDLPFTYSFANLEGDEWCFEAEVDPFTRKPKWNPKILERIRRLLEDEAIRKLGFNIKFDNRMSEKIGIKVAGRCEDVMWKAHVVNSAEIRHALKPLADKYSGGAVDDGDEKELGEGVKACRRAVKKLGWKIAREESGSEAGDKDKAYKADYWLPNAVFRLAIPEIRDPLIGRYPRLRDLNRIYASKDAQRTMLLDMMYTEIMNEQDLWQVYEREIKMAPVTCRAEDVGVRIFEDRCADLGKECNGKLSELRGSLTKIFGEFNVEVPDNRVRHYLYGPKSEGCLELPVTVRTDKTKMPSVAKEVLTALGARYESSPIVRDIIRDIQNFSKYKKVWSDYVQKYMHHARDDGTGQLILHADFRQIGPTTGRMACADPPLQQTPKRAKKGDIMKRVRYPFGPRKGNIWIHQDYKSIEPRILAEESEEPDIIRIFNEGQACPFAKNGWTNDPYEVLVEAVSIATGIDIKELDAMFEERGGARQVCKNNYLGWTYGEGIKKLAAQMGCSYEVAERIIYTLQITFGRVGPFMREMQAIAKVKGCIWNRYGRKCMIPPPSKVFDEELGMWKWREWWYKATNYLIQGTAADMLKEAAIRLGADPVYYAYNPVGGSVDKLSQKAGYLRGSGCEIVMFIHDEIVVEVPFKLAVRNEKFIRGIGDVMADNQGMFKRVATPVDAKVTWNAWSDPEELETIWN